MNEKIMVVDDHDDIREVIHVLLTNEGYQIIEAKNGKEALELLDDSIDLIILDVMMPEMNGYQVCLLMREKTNAPILFLTAKGQESDKTLGFSSGGDFGKVLDEPVGITPLYSLQNDFEQYSFNRLISGSVKFKDGEGIVYVSSMHLLKYVKYYFYVALFVSLLIFFLPTFIFIKRKVKYINILKQEVLNMSQGGLSHAMTIMSHDELAILAQEMDTLRITLASNYQNEARIKEAHQEMITCLSHDLRTPLTALRGYLDILCLHCYKDEKQMDHYLNSCIEKTEQIKDLSNKTFEYSLVYNDDLIPSLETISSESFIQYIEEHLEYLELEGFKIEKEITISSVQLQLDLSMMKRMMDNICSNIQKYARKEQPIYLQISIEKGNLKIVFENEKKETNHEVESNKIGLKSVKKIIEIHQGQCFIQDLMDSFILIITFPCHL